MMIKYRFIIILKHSDDAKLAQAKAFDCSIIKVNSTSYYRNL